MLLSLITLYGKCMDNVIVYNSSMVNAIFLLICLI